MTVGVLHALEVGTVRASPVLDDVVRQLAGTHPSALTRAAAQALLDAV